MIINDESCRPCKTNDSCRPSNCTLRYIVAIYCRSGGSEQSRLQSLLDCLTRGCGGLASVIEANGRLEKQIGLSIDFYILMIGTAIAQAIIRLASNSGGPD